MRYHLFSYDSYYPSGGIGDYCGSFDSPEEAAVYIRSSRYMDHWHMVITNEGGNLEETEHWWSEFAKAWVVNEKKDA